MCVCIYFTQFRFTQQPSIPSASAPQLAPPPPSAGTSFPSQADRRGSTCPAAPEKTHLPQPAVLGGEPPSHWPSRLRFNRTTPTDDLLAM